MQHTLSISPNYVRSWGFWEAIRELVQNALDQRDADPDCEFGLRLTPRGQLQISTSTGHIPPRALLLGETSKNGVETRGKHGEGLKLAMLALMRLGHQVKIHQGSVDWTVRFEEHPVYGCQVLSVHETQLTVPEPGVMIMVDDVTEAQLEDIHKNFKLELASDNAILDSPDEVGRIYVGGLFVFSQAKFRYGYAFKPGAVPLDRDRCIIPEFNLGTRIAELWSKERPDSPEFWDLLNNKAADLDYLRYSSGANEATSKIIAQRFEERHGTNTVAVSSPQEVAAAQQAGVPFALVSEQVKELMLKVRRIVVPLQGGPVDQLKGFVDKYRWRLDTEMKIELDNIIEGLERQQQALTDATKSA